MTTPATYEEVQAAHEAYRAEVERLIGRSTVMARVLMGNVTTYEWIEESHAHTRKILDRMEAAWANCVAVRATMNDRPGEP